MNHHGKNMSYVPPTPLGLSNGISIKGKKNVNTSSGAGIITGSSVANTGAYPFGASNPSKGAGGGRAGASSSTKNIVSSSVIVAPKLFQVHDKLKSSFSEMSANMQCKYTTTSERANHQHPPLDFRWTKCFSKLTLQGILICDIESSSKPSAITATVTAMDSSSDGTSTIVNTTADNKDTVSLDVRSIDLRNVRSVKMCQVPRVIRIANEDDFVLYLRLDNLDIMRDWLFSFHSCILWVASSSSSSSPSNKPISSETSNLFKPTPVIGSKDSAKTESVNNNQQSQPVSIAASSAGTKTKSHQMEDGNLVFSSTTNSSASIFSSTDTGAFFPLASKQKVGMIKVISPYPSQTSTVSPKIPANNSSNHDLQNFSSSNISSKRSSPIPEGFFSMEEDIGGNAITMQLSSIQISGSQGFAKPQPKKEYPYFKKEYTHGVGSLQGNRRSMEDVHVAIPNMSEEMKSFRNASSLLKSSSSSSSPSKSLTLLPSRTGYYSVFDGHGGSTCAKFAAERVHRYSCRENDFPTSEEIAEAFSQVDKEYIEFALSSDPQLHDGTCSIQAYIEYEKDTVKNLEVARRVIIASLGDSKAILCKVGGEAKTISAQEHHPGRLDEQMRIEKVGGWIVKEKEMAVSRVKGGEKENIFIEISRVNGELSVSRALGDIDYKYPMMNDFDWFPPIDYLENMQSNISAVAEDLSRASSTTSTTSTASVAAFKFNFTGDLLISEPEISEISKDDVHDGEFIVLACDGVFESLSLDQVISSTREHLMKGSSPDEAAVKLVELAIQRGSCDNATAIVIPLRFSL